MIRRGLHAWLAVGFLSMGAAHCIGEVYTSSVPAAGKTVTFYWAAPFWASGPDPRIHYGFTSVSGVTTWTTSPGLSMTFDNASSTGPTFRYVLTIPANMVMVRLVFNNESYGNRVWDNNNGADYVYSWAASGDAQFAENFPDWSNAATKIPLGFGMGMAFWAAAVALAIPIKWAKDLASAAS